MTYSDIRARARENLRGHWDISIAAAFVASIFGALIVGSNFSIRIDEEVLYRLPRILITAFKLMVTLVSSLSLVQFILGGVVQLGYSKFLLNQHDGKAYNLKDLFCQFDRFSVGFLQRFLRGLYVFLWSLLFVIPGMVKYLGYAMTPYILTDHPELTAKEAIRRSQELMDGHKIELFCLNLSFIGWCLLSVFTLGIGLLWLNPYIEAANAAFYRELTAKKQETYIEF